MLFLPGRHIPIDTSLCSQSPQVRIYGFVAAGINTLRADKKQRNQQTFKQTTHSTVWSFQLHWFIIALLLLGVQTTMDNTVTLIRLNMAQLSLHVGLSATKICINIKKFSLFHRYLKNKSTRWVSILSCIFHFLYFLRLLQCGDIQCVLFKHLVEMSVEIRPWYTGQAGAHDCNRCGVCVFTPLITFFWGIILKRTSLGNILLKKMNLHWIKRHICAARILWNITLWLK